MLILPDKKALVVRPRNPQQLLTLIPTAKPLTVQGKEFVAVPHRLEETRVLRNLGMRPPSPIKYHYDWSGTYKPFKAQGETAEFLTLNPRAYVLNGMGCIAGDDRVRVSRKGKSYETSLRELFAAYTKSDKVGWRARSLKGDVFGMHKLLDVLYKGEKPTLRITLEDGKTFRATPDHRIARPDGSWTEAGDLRVGDDLVTNGTASVVVVPKTSRVARIEDGGVVDVYDLCMEAPHHNFVVNGVVVHNSGKTMATLWAYDYLRTKGFVHKMLVVCPLSTMERTWADEIFKHFPHLDYRVLYGNRAKRFKLLDMPADIYIVNHDGLKIIADGLKGRQDIDIIVVDEVAQAARNASTDRWKVLNQIVNKQFEGTRWCWGLTGTPTPNAPTDAWAQCRLITPTSVPPYFNRFKDQVMKQVNNFLWVPRPDAMETVHRVMQPSIRFSREECVDLPPCLFQTRHVPLTPSQQTAYKQMLSQLRVASANGEILAVNEAVKAAKLVQIACGVAYDTDGNEVTIGAQSRLEVVEEIVEQADAKVIVFVPFVSSVHYVADHLRSKGYSVECIYGEVSKTERDRIFGEFQNCPDPKVIVAQPAAMSHGLTLVAANTIIWYAPIFSNDTFDQACARITRPGQTRNQLIVKIEGSPIELKAYDRLQNKQKMQGILLSMVEDDRADTSTHKDLTAV